MNPISAQEARTISQSNSPESALLEEFWRKVHETIQSGETKFNFFTDGKHFSDSELKSIRDLRYEIYWNGPCLWYEVSW